MRRGAEISLHPLSLSMQTKIKSQGAYTTQTLSVRGINSLNDNFSKINIFSILSSPLLLKLTPRVLLISNSSLSITTQKTVLFYYRRKSNFHPSQIDILKL